MIIKVTVNKELKEEIKAYAKAVDRSVSSLMMRSIRCYIKMHPVGKID